MNKDSDKMKVDDIPRFFRPPNYNAHCNWNFLEEQLKHWDDRPYSPINLDPDFQRGHVWTRQKQIDYVEFCLKGGQSSREILWNNPGWQTHYRGEMVLVDGKQRLQAVRKFIANKLPIFGGYKLNDFDDPKRLLRMGDAYFIMKVNNLQTRKQVLEWYLQLNAGGVVHKKSELDKVRQLLIQEKQ